MPWSFLDHSGFWIYSINSQGAGLWVELLEDRFCVYMCLFPFFALLRHLCLWNVGFGWFFFVVGSWEWEVGSFTSDSPLSCGAFFLPDSRLIEVVCNIGLSTWVDPKLWLVSFTSSSLQNSNTSPPHISSGQRPWLFFLPFWGFRFS